MAEQLTGDPFVGPSNYVPRLGLGIGNIPRVEILRRRFDGEVVPVWSVLLGTPKAARTLHKWMMENPESWSVWGRLALRLGTEAAGRMIMAAATRHEQARIESERERRDAEKEQRRLSREITLYYYDPKKKAPSLGLERGNESRPFFRMTFTEKWERDRVLDWIKHQRAHFADMEEMWAEHGALALERHILAGMRETERDVKARGMGAGGRRPLRFWRGE
ncbi:hypothetical protein [Sphingobium limneticum]|uniref:Uncharacterized protein n=1 Tax=Sphingobium limneticum TaxID=1007511 RepID=A0A5J5I7K3_9SPHN|nr:hypothetical protein [Sphingobium limneticum]KAA9019610.1 hypothetical protein F4U96_04990 [Sphingobium limneticum]KAA9032068.1 hypothetical protein F4U95_04990 [Sphingobium limneticum]